MLCLFSLFIYMRLKLCNAGKDQNGHPREMHTSESAPTLYYGSSQRPLQIQPHGALEERFSLSPASAPFQHDTAPETPTWQHSSSLPAQPAHSPHPSSLTSRQETLSEELSFGPAPVYTAGELPVPD